MEFLEFWTELGYFASALFILWVIVAVIKGLRKEKAEKENGE